jgi:glutamate-1-semialdehyde 2,1-aminomutase
MFSGPDAFRLRIVPSMISRRKSEQMFAEALRHIPGGVNSPVRAFRAVGGQPFFVERARGARIWDVDGNELLDYVCTWGPAILGHAHAKIIHAVKEAAEHGTSFGTPNPSEITMARAICSALPSIQKVRMCNSGTEATMSAIRLARGYTGRDKIIKFEGCYHGHVDSLLVKAGSGALTLGQPDSAGVPAAFAQHTILVPFNDPKAVQAAFKAHADEIAGVILEPIPANAGLYLPKPGFLEFLREITERHSALLIFDEVMTGFRVDWGGAQQRFGVMPDLTCLGKVIGGGLPVGAFGGRGEIMDQLAPLGPVYQAGTLSGNPVAMAAGIAALDELRYGESYSRLESLGAAMEAGMKEAAAAAKIRVQFNRCGSMFCTFFCDKPVHSLAEAMRSDRERFAKFFHAMLQEGIYLAPSQFEAGFISAAHTPEDMERTVAAARRVMRSL